MTDYTFSSVTVGPETSLNVILGDKIEGEDKLPLSYSVVTDSFVGTLDLQHSANNGATWETVLTTTTDVAVTTSLASGKYRWRCSSYTSGEVDTTLEQEVYTLESWKNVEGDTVAKVMSDGIHPDSLYLQPNVIVGRCHAGAGAGAEVIIGNGFAITEDEETSVCTLTTAAGYGLIVRNTETDETINIPAFITLIQYQITGGGASAYKGSNLALSCSGGSGETKIGSLSVEEGDVVRMVIPADVGSSLVADDANIAGGDVVIYVNAVEKVRAKGGVGGLTSASTSTTFAGGSGGTTPAGMGSWDGGVGRRDSSGTAFGAGVRGAGSGCGGNVSSASGTVTAAGCGFVILRY